MEGRADSMTGRSFGSSDSTAGRMADIIEEKVLDMPEEAVEVDGAGAGAGAGAGWAGVWRMRTPEGWARVVDDRVRRGRRRVVRCMMADDE